MKKLTLSLAAAGLFASSLGAYAALPTGAAPFQVVVPNLKSGVELIVEGLYLQPTNSDLGYNNLFGNSTPATLNTNVSYVRPNYNLGFRVGLGYSFANSGNDVQVAWTYFNRGISAFVTSPFIGTGVDVGINGNVANSADASFKYDAVDLDVGQYVSMGTRLQTRWFMGVRGAQLNNNVTGGVVVAAFNDPVVTGLAAAGTFNSKFTGIGPRAGVDSSYHIGQCFGIGAHFAASLLVGQVATSANGVVSVNRPGGFSATQIFSSTADNQTRVVPAFDARVGANYTFAFKKSGSSMTIEAGYQVTQYMGAIDRLRVVDTFNPGSATTTTSSIGFNGPYLTLDMNI